MWLKLQYIPRNMHTVFALLCFVVVIHWLTLPYPSGLLHWHCGNLTIAPVPAKQPWWIWINTSCEFIMNDCITTTKQSTTKPCAYFLGYTVYKVWHSYCKSQIYVGMYSHINCVYKRSNSLSRLTKTTKPHCCIIRFYLWLETWEQNIYRPWHTHKDMNSVVDILQWFPNAHLRN